MDRSMMNVVLLTSDPRPTAVAFGRQNKSDCNPSLGCRYLPASSCTQTVNTGQRLTRYISIYIYISIYLSLSLSLYIYIYIYIYKYIYIYIYTYKYVHIYTYIYIYTYYIHTYIYINICYFFKVQRNVRYLRFTRHVAVKLYIYLDLELRSIDLYVYIYI